MNPEIFWRYHAYFIWKCISYDQNRMEYQGHCCRKVQHVSDSLL